MKIAAVGFWAMRVTLALCLIVAAGCVNENLSGPGRDGSTANDGAPRDVYFPPYYKNGYVTLRLWQETDPPSSNAGISLETVYYMEAWNTLFGPTYPGYISHTPDNVNCEMHTVGPESEPQYQPPPAFDGGRVTAWVGPSDPHPFETVWNGAAYDSDQRSFGDPDWPAWIGPSGGVVQFEGHGSPEADPFRTEVDLAMVPEILSPPAGVTLQPDADGNFLISWVELPEFGDETIVTFEFPMDLDTGHIRCSPRDVDHFLLPELLVERFSWGSGTMSLWRVHTVELQAGEVTVYARTVRIRRQNVSFEIAP